MRKVTSAAASDFKSVKFVHDLIAVRSQFALVFARLVAIRAFAGYVSGVELHFVSRTVDVGGDRLRDMGAAFNRRP
ncbi:hypothetical protein [Pannonibacter carbonis]|uniref:hypothetical protein n=1 Tax=Pannonibacter carbonis TaxID=2067569 RepID=UPI0013009105|nr:hypothetical protein [Pannonibacter carbonis]